MINIEGKGTNKAQIDKRNDDKKTKKKSPEDISVLGTPVCRKKKAASYSPALHCSTIGAGGLNFSVRNGKRWNPAAIAT